MAKFAIACPVCGKYAEAKTGFFAKKKIECACGNIINIRTDKLASRQCLHCGNQIVFDQTKGADALCRSAMRRSTPCRSSSRWRPSHASSAAYG